MAFFDIVFDINFSYGLPFYVNKKDVMTSTGLSIFSPSWTLLAK